MARSLFLSNGSLMIGYDKYGQVRDLYYPYVGQDSHTNGKTSAHKIGVWVDGDFSWVNDGSWDIHVDYHTPYMEAIVEARSTKFQISLHFEDFIDVDEDIYFRHVTVSNHIDKERDIRLFMHQRFAISEQTRGDTALFVPDGNFILDYRGRISFAISSNSLGGSFSQYSVGVHGIEGKQGTFRDAEDGELSNNPVEHGSVDSCIRLNFSCPSRGSAEATYHLIASNSHSRVHEINAQININGYKKYQSRTRSYWSEWLRPAMRKIKKLRPLTREGVIKSLLIIKSHIDDRGGVLASGDSEMLNYARDNYSYCWPRDGAYVLRPLIALGIYEEAKRFFDFTADTLSDNGSVMHKYQPDRSVGSTWHPLVQNGRPELAIQEDETAIVIVMLRDLLQQIDDKTFARDMYDRLVKPAADFMARYVDNQTGLPHASYDLWEQIFATFTYTANVTYAGLRAASEIARQIGDDKSAINWDVAADDMQGKLGQLYNQQRGYFFKSLLLDQNSGEVQYDSTIDASALYGALVFGPYDAKDKHVITSIETIENTLHNYSPSMGLPRYEGDGYFKKDGQGPNPWFVCTLWLAQMYIATKDLDKAEDIVRWSREHMLPSGVLSEQIDPISSEPIGVAPLAWSQAEYVSTVVALLNAKRAV